MDDSVIAVELEALQHTYNEELQVRGPDGGQCTSITLQLLPRGTAHEWERYVEAALRLGVPPAYPDSLPRLELVDVKGLSDEQQAQCLASLWREAEGLRGEMMLGHLCETALDWVSAANHPPVDPCVFCLEPVAPGEGGDELRPAYDVLKLACFHCFHMPCFGPWWAWQQRQLAAREVQLTAEYKSMVGEKLREEQIERDERGAYTVRCPSCRAAIPPSSLAHAWPALRACTADSWSKGQGHCLTSLDAQAAQRLAALQQQQRAGLALQQRAGGLIDSNKGVAVSLSELQVRSSDSSRQGAVSGAAAGEREGASAAEGCSEEAPGQAGGQREPRPGPLMHGGGGRGRHGGGGRHRTGGRGRQAEGITAQPHPQQQQPREVAHPSATSKQQAGQQQEVAGGQGGGQRGRSRHRPGGDSGGRGGQGVVAGRPREPSAAPQASPPCGTASGSTEHGQIAAPQAAAAAAAAAALHRRSGMGGGPGAPPTKGPSSKGHGTGPPPGFEPKEAAAPGGGRSRGPPPGFGPKEVAARRQEVQGRGRMPLQQPRGPSL